MKYIIVIVFLLSACASVPCDCEKQVAETRTYFLTLTVDDARLIRYCMEPWEAADIEAASAAVEAMRKKSHQSTIETDRKLLGR